LPYLIYSLLFDIPMKQATAVNPETSNGKDDSMTGDRPQQQE
jgi:hypothetical protein